MEIGRVYLFYARTGLIGTWQAIPHMFTWVCRRRMNYWAQPKFRERMTTDEPWLLKENDEPWHLGVGWIIGRHQSSENIWRAVFGLGKIPYNCWCPTFFLLVQIRVFFLTQTSLQPYRNRKRNRTNPVLAPSDCITVTFCYQAYHYRENQTLPINLMFAI